MKIKGQKELGKDDRIKILFIDEMNSLQSQIAEYFLNEMYSRTYAAYSAGARFDHIDCELISVMFQNGYDIREARAKDFRSKQIPTEFDLLVFLEESTYDRIKDMVPYSSKKILKDFGSRSDIKANDDKELFQAYGELINRVRDWVKENFANADELKELR